LVGRKAGLLPCLGESPLYGLPEAKRVIAWMLASEMMILRVKQDTLVSAWVLEDGTSKFLAVFATNHKGPD
jgi:hypothetical protein